MSDNVIDLFDKKTPQSKTLLDLTRKLQAFKERLVDENHYPLSHGASLLYGTITYALNELPPRQAAMTQYSLQHRSTEGDDPKHYTLLTGYSYREHLLMEGKCHKPKLLWQIRVTTKAFTPWVKPKPFVACSNPDHIKPWLDKLCPNSPLDVLESLGLIQRSIEYMDGVLVRTRATEEFFEMNYDSAHEHYRIKLFAKGIKEDYQLSLE